MIKQTLLYFRIRIENGVVDIIQTAPRFHYETKSNVHFVEVDYTSKLLSVKQFHTPNDHMIIGDTFTLHKGHLGQIHLPSNTYQDGITICNLAYFDYVENIDLDKIEQLAQDYYLEQVKAEQAKLDRIINNMLTNWNPKGEEFKKQVDENIKFLYNERIENEDEISNS